MKLSRAALFAATGVALLAAMPLPAKAQQEFVYGSWLPPREYMNAVAIPNIFKDIEEQTKGQIKWKIVAGGQLADGKATFSAVQDNLMQAGIAIAVYVPSAAPSLHTIYSTLVFGEDVVAASGAALETMTLNCPSCQDEFRKLNAVALAGWVAAPYKLLCTNPIKTVADIKGKRIRATGGNAEMLRSVGGVPIAGTLTEALNLLQRGGLDCVLGTTNWLQTIGYADFAKHVTDFPLGMSGPAVGFWLNRDTWNKLTLEQKKIHMRAAARLSAETAIGGFVIANENSLTWAVKEKGVQVVKVGKDFEDLIAAYAKAEPERNAAVAKGFGVADPQGIMAAYRKNFEKWQKLSKEIGRDPKKFEEAIMREIYDKADPAKL
jgi:TRAP-type C4-dicarboxylate transport system substrate-binding protein